MRNILNNLWTLKFAISALAIASTNLDGAPVPREIQSAAHAYWTSSRTFPGTKAPAKNEDASAVEDAVKSLYRAGKYDKAIERLRSALGEAEEDHKLRGLLIVCLLKLGLVAEAENELNYLLPFAGKDPWVTANLNTLRTTVAHALNQDLARKELLSCVESFDVQCAERVLSGEAFSEEGRNVLRVYLALYQGNYEEARKRLQPVANQKLRAELAREIAESEQLSQVLEPEQWALEIGALLEWEIHEGLTNQWDVYSKYHPEMDPCSGSGDLKCRDRELLAIYRNLIEQAALRAPLNEGIIDDLFHNALLFGSYEEIMTLGNKILDSRGFLKIFLEGKDVGYEGNSWTLYQLVIDKNRRVVAVSFIPYWSDRREDWSGIQATARNGKRLLNVPLRPVEIPFEAIKKLDQRISCSGDRVAEEKSYIIRFNGQTVIQHLAGSNFLRKAYGEKVLRLIYENVARYIHHVLENPRISVKFEKTDKVCGMGSGWATFVDSIMVGVSGALEEQARERGDIGAARRNEESRRMSERRIEERQHKNEEVTRKADEGARAFDAQIKAKRFGMIDPAVFTALEELLDLID